MECRIIRGWLAMGCFALVSILSFSAHAADDDESRIRAADTRFWQAYNACDMKTMDGLITEDVEFYHDKGGLTAGREALIESLRKGPCGDPKMHLRREADGKSIAFHPMKGGYGVLSGRHLFYVTNAGSPEHLDGQAEFTTLWKYDGGQWRMHRVLSYDHGPAAYTPPARTFALPASALGAFAGRYRSQHVGDIVVIVDGDHLKLTAGTLVVTLYPEAANRFFAKERDLRFQFDVGGEGKARALAVYENGAVSERAERVP